jgi:hypothetical protein
MYGNNGFEQLLAATRIPVATCPPRMRGIAMKPRSLLAVSLMLAALSVPWTGAHSAVAARTAGPIVAKRLIFYRGVDCFNARKHSKPATAFGTGANYINAVVVYQTWQGFHRVTFMFYAPNGKLNKKYTDAAKDHGSTRDCAWIGIAGHARARMLGRWTVKVVVDGKQTLIGHFRLYRHA